MLKIPLLQKLLLELTKLPGIGPKSAERLAFHLLQKEENELFSLINVLSELKSQIGFCPRCHNYSEKSSLCYFCLDSNRYPYQICVVEDPFAIERIESTRCYHGVYHVLHGSINLLMGLTPEKLKIQSLQRRVEAYCQNPNSHELEIILALDSDLEGDTTALYLQELLAPYPLRLTRLARGVPLGTGMSYLDERTLSLALQNRIELP